MHSNRPKCNLSQITCMQRFLPDFQCNVLLMIFYFEGLEILLFKTLERKKLEDLNFFFVPRFFLLSGYLYIKVSEKN